MPPEERPRPRPSPRASGRRASSGLLRLVAPSLAVSLALTGFGYAYLWDDYAFLAGWRDALVPWTPDPFYRPLPRGLVFGLLDRLGPGGEWFAHAINAGLLAFAVWLLEGVASRLAGRRAGFYAAVAFASLGAVGGLVGWASFVQELMAVVFVLLALRLELEGRTAWALVAGAAGLLSKETAALALPVVAFARWIAWRSREGLGRRVAAFAMLGAAWAFVHPGIRALLANGFRSGATSYVGLEQPERWGPYLWQYLLALVNIPATGLGTPWPSGLAGPTLLALAILTAGLVAMARMSGGDAKASRKAGPESWGRLAIVAALLAIPPLLVTATMVRHWAPYFVVPAAIGSSLVLGAALARRHVAAAGALLVAFLLLGVWSRGLDLESVVCTERNLRASSRAIRTVEADFRRLHAAFPPRSQLLLSTQLRGSLGIYATLHEHQAPRFWYRDPSLLVRRPWEREPGRGMDFLFVVTPDRGVVEIDTRTLQPITPGVDLPPIPLETAVRTYATGLFGSGETEPAIDVLLRAPSVDAGVASIHGRLAAAILLAEGRDDEAAAMLAVVPPIPRDYAIQSLRVILLEPLRRPIEPFLLRAFEVADDAAARAELAAWAATNGLDDVAGRVRTGSP